MFTSKSFVGSVFSGLALIASATVDPTDYVWLSKDEDPGHGSFTHNNDGLWHEFDGQTEVTAGAPQAGKKYLVQNAGTGEYRLLRNNGNDVTFKGDSLTFDRGELRSSSGYSVTVTNLIVYKGRLGTGYVGGAIFGGEYFLQDEDGDLEFRGGRMRLTRLTAKVHGGKGTTLTIQNSTDAAGPLDFPFYTVWAKGDCTDFRGTWKLNSVSTCRTALVADSPASIGVLDSESALVECANRSGFYGAGLDLAESGWLVNAPGGLDIGSFTDGLALGGGVAITGGETLTVSNRQGTTTLGNVAISGFNKIVFKTDGIRLTSGFANGSLPLEAEKDVLILFDSSDSYVDLSANATFPSGMRWKIAYDGDTTDLATNKNDVTSFRYPILKIPGLGDTLTTEDFDLITPNVPLASLVIEDGILYWVRTDARKAVFMTGWTTGNTSRDCWFAASETGGMAWSDGAVPSSGKYYVVPYCQTVRSGKTTAFPGDFVAILYGASISYSDQSSTTLGNVYGFAGGLMLQRGTGQSRTVGGVLTLPDGGLDKAFTIATEGPNGGTVSTLKLDMTLTGSGCLAFRGIDGNSVKSTTDLNGSFADTTRGNSEFTVRGDNSAFTGGIRIKNVGGFVAFSGENSMGSNPSHLLADGLTVDSGARLVAKNDYTLGANRGISLPIGNADYTKSTLEVDAGKTLTVNGPVRGSATLAKSGAGTLALNGASTATGGVRLESGTLVVGDPAALGSSGGLVYVDGVLRVACTGLKVGGEIPFSNPSVQAKTPVKVSVAAFDAFPNCHRTELFVLTDPAATFDPTMIDIQGFDEDEVVWTTEAKSDGLHVTARIRKGAVLIFK